MQLFNIPKFLRLSPHHVTHQTFRGTQIVFIFSYREAAHVKKKQTQRKKRKSKSKRKSKFHDGPEPKTYETKFSGPPKTNPKVYRPAATWNDFQSVLNNNQPDNRLNNNPIQVNELNQGQDPMIPPNQFNQRLLSTSLQGRDKFKHGRGQNQHFNEPNDNQNHQQNLNQPENPNPSQNWQKNQQFHPQNQEFHQQNFFNHGQQVEGQQNQQYVHQNQQFRESPNQQYRESESQPWNAPQRLTPNQEFKQPRVLQQSFTKTFSGPTFGKQANFTPSQSTQSFADDIQVSTNHMISGEPRFARKRPKENFIHQHYGVRL